MTEPGQLSPSTDSWVASVHAGAREVAPLGSAVVVDARRVLTCAHVVVLDDGKVREPLWVCFPKLDVAGDDWRLVASVDWDYAPPMTDVAVLVLEQDVPDGVDPAPLRIPRPADVVGKRWWAFGFPNGDPIGDCADGLVGAALTRGWVRLHTTSQYPVKKGFSGGGLWSPDYEAVIGLVGHSHANGDGRAIMLHRADQVLPGQKLALLTGWSARAAGEVALAAWGWSLATDPEGVRHWQPRARGVSVDSERGYRFRGRSRALTEIIDWLDRPVPDRRVLVVTGSPGAGKSAVLGRVVTTADAAIAAQLPASDDAVRARIGMVACAVHAKSKTALEVAAEIARAASAQLPIEPGDIAPVVREALQERPGGRFNVIIDALDEAAGPVQAWEIIDKIALPLAETCSDLGVQIVLGARQKDDKGLSLLDQFTAAKSVIDLDKPAYFDADDLAAYALACLQLAGDERPGSPYHDKTVALPLARSIAESSHSNFLIAGLVARGHGMHDMVASNPERPEFPVTADLALTGYLQRVGPVAGLSAREVLTGLAFAEAPGLPAELWQLALDSIYGVRVEADILATFARSGAANFLVESGTDRTAQVYRLFHQRLNDALLQARARVATTREDQRALTRAFIRRGREGRWQGAPEYLLRSLAGHADAARMIDELLTDDDYLLRADLPRLLLAAGHPMTARGRRRVQLLGLTPEAASAGIGERAAMFSVTQAQERIQGSYIDSTDAPYFACWAHTRPRGARLVLEGHSRSVTGVCAVEVDGRQLLASASGDRTVRVWDPATGEQKAVLTGHQKPVYAMCVVEVEGRQLLASVGGDETRVWDPATGRQRAVLRWRQGRVNGVCAVEVAGRQLLAIAGDDRTVRLWDPATGLQQDALEGHQKPVNAVCAVEVAGRQLLASASRDWTLRLWDPATGQQQAVLEGHHDWVTGVCAVQVAGRQLLASASDDCTVRLWDPATGQQLAVLAGHDGGVNAIRMVEVGGRQLLASASSDQTMRLWDPATGQQQAVLEGHQGAVNGVWALEVAGGQLLASAGADQTVRVWDSVTGQQQVVAEGHDGAVTEMCVVEIAGRQLLASAGEDQTLRLWNSGTGQQQMVMQGNHGAVNAVCAVDVAGRQLLASAGRDWTVRLWEPATGQQQAVLEGHRDWVTGVCAVQVAGQQLLASASRDWTIRLWDPATGQQQAVLGGQPGAVTGIWTAEVAGRQLLASSSYDQTIQLWDPATGEQEAVLEGHQSVVTEVCAVRVAGRQRVASASYDQTVRLWDPATGEQEAVLEGHHDRVTAVCAVQVAGRQLLASASHDRTVRVWDVATAACLVTIPTHHRALRVLSIANRLAIGLGAGLLVVDLRTRM